MPKRRAWVFFFPLLLAVLWSCGSDEEAPVYDTAGNPHGFPAQACELLDAIETGQLAAYDVITEAFGRLYLENQALLEDRNWQEVIRQLGRKLHHKADSLVQQGVTTYSQAAGFYILASFADQDDTQLSEKAQMFTTWKEAMESHDPAYACSPTSAHLSHRLDFLRRFILGDSLQRAFGQRFLVHQVLDSLLAATPPEKIQSMARPHRTFLAYSGLGEASISDPVESLEEPPIDIVAYRVVAVAADLWRAELYFASRETLAHDYVVNLSHGGARIDSAGHMQSYSESVEVEPLDPTSTWRIGQVYAVATIFGAKITPTDLEFNLTPAGAASSGSSAGMLTRRLQVSVEAEMPCAE